MPKSSSDADSGFARMTYPGAGVSLSCIEAGPEDGPLVILLHGFPEDALNWRRQIEALAQAGFHVLAPDQRGYGESDKPIGEAAYELDRLAADVLALGAAKGQASFDLMGHDWGGAVAWWVAARHPDQVRRLVILNAPNPSVMAGYLVTSPSQARRLYGLVPDAAYSGMAVERFRFRSFDADPAQVQPRRRLRRPGA